MPDQYGRVTGRDWMGLAGAIGSVDSMRRGQEYLEMRQAGEDREATKFEQSQEDRATKLRVQQDVANEYTQGGVVDPHGQITDEGYKMFANPQARNKGVAVKALEGKGKDAFAYLKANTEFTGNILLNATNQKNLQMLAFDKANRNYEKIDGLLKAAQVEEGRGQSGRAAQYIASAIEDGMMRRHAKAVGDNIEVWEVVGGIKQSPTTMTVQEALMEAQNYTRENYTSQAATHIIAGYEQNKEPRVFEFRTPEGKGVRAVQIFKSGEVDYIFFNPGGTILKDAPENIEQAYSKGWELEEKALGRERAVTKEERAVTKEEREVSREERAVAEARIKGRQTKELGLSFTEKERYKNAGKELAGIQIALADPFTKATGDPAAKKIRAGELKDLMKELESKESGLSRRDPAGGVTDSRQVTLRQVAQELKTKFPSASPEQLKELLKLKTGVYGESEEAQGMWKRIMGELETRPQMDTGIRQQSGLGEGDREPAADYLDRYQRPQRPRWGYVR